MADTQQQTSTGTTFRLMYRSRDRVSPEDRREEFASIFSQARSDNQKRSITGALLLSGEWFVQVLEGTRPLSGPSTPPSSATRATPTSS